MRHIRTSVQRTVLQGVTGSKGKVCYNKYIYYIEIWQVTLGWDAFRASVNKYLFTSWVSNLYLALWMMWGGSSHGRIQGGGVPLPSPHILRGNCPLPQNFKRGKEKRGKRKRWKKKEEKREKETKKAPSKKSISVICGVAKQFWGGAKKISALARFAHYGDIMGGKCRMSLICKGGHTNIHDIRNVW